ncbi:MAG: sensor domain-containing phosphodiesterase [Sphingomonadaceae bacterium]
MYYHQIDESSRLAALHSLRILDSPTQDCFDRITRLCTNLFDCSISLITLIDERRQWFLSRQGLDCKETPREVSFCSHAMENGRSLLVLDAQEDVRFKSNPLVIGAPGIRSYLGHPLADSNGIPIGALCVADERGSRFAEHHLTTLAPLARLVEDLIAAHDQRLRAADLAVHLNERSKCLEDSNRIFKQAEKIAKIGSWELDIERDAFRCSDEVFSIYEIPKELRMDLRKSVDLYAPQDRSIVLKAIADAIKHRSVAQFEADLTTSGGTRKRIRARAEYIAGNEELGPRLVGIVKDISETYHAHLALQRAADYDMLTGLRNRHAFDRCLRERIEAYRRTGEDFFVFLLDLDGFKDVNDTYGHLVGDVVLEEVSARITRAVPDGAVAARWGGDEFAVIGPQGLSREEAAELGEALINAITAQLAIAGRKVGVSATCGLACTERTSSGRELLRRADLALYEGKRREPGLVHVYADSLESASRLRQEAIATTRSALEEDLIFAAYQPIVRLSDSRLVGLEALMRLNTRSGEMLTATQVLPAIIDPVLSREISEKIITHVCRDFPEIEAGQPSVEFISINATEADLLNRDFCDRLLSSLEVSGIPAQRIMLEITETMLLVNDVVSVQGVLSRLRAAGMRIALDDFGTGFSSLSHLRDFSIDRVKIDGSFVQKMCFDHQSRLIVQALIAMGKNLGLEIIAEGIETEQQRTLLMQMGCCYGQGYLFSPAETACRLKLLALGKANASPSRSAA